jgi:hypothetical protein
MKALVVIATLAVALGVGAAVQAQTPADPESVVRAFVDAFNAGDAEASASYFAEDGTAEGPGCRPSGVCRGRAEIQAALQAEIDEGVQDEILDLTVSGNTVSVRIAETAPGLAELGVERIIILLTATVEDGEITSATGEFDLSDGQTAMFAAALEEQAEEPSLPESGTGYASPASSPPWRSPAGLAVLAVLGAGLLAGGALVTRRHEASD